MSIKNTKDCSPVENLVTVMPGGIEAQEAHGQQMLCASAQLSRTMGYDGDSKKAIESLGIKVIGESEGDELFYDVELPEGFKIEATDHSMWSHVKNEKGDIVANIFYKAAFYDRTADFHLTKEATR